MSGVHLSIPSPDLSWSSFHIGPLTIHIYALCIIAGIIAIFVLAVVIDTLILLAGKAVTPWTRTKAGAR